MKDRVRAAGAAVAIVLAATSIHAARPRIYALTGGTVIPSPGKTIENGSVVLRDGLIESVGKDVKIPADAVTIDATGMFVYPGLIDAGGWSQPRDSPAPSGSTERGRTAPRESEAGPVYALAVVRPERRAADALQPFEGDRKRESESWRKLGFTALLAAPTKGVFRGSGALILLVDDAPVNDLIVKDGIGAHVAFETSGFGEGYPTSVMGAAAAMRQTLLDAERLVVWNERYAKNPVGMPHPDRLPAMEVLHAVLTGAQPLYLEALSKDDVLLADRIAREHDLKLVIVGSGTEAEIAAEIAKTGRAIVYPVRFPDKPKVDGPDEALDVPLRDLRRYLDAASAPKILRDAGVTIALTAHGLKNTSDFPGNVRKMIEAGLPEAEALAALTVTPAELLGVSRTMGTLEAGKIANVVVTDGRLFAKDAKVRRVFVDGTDYPVEEKAKPKGDPNAVVDPRGTWSVIIELAAQPVQRTWTIRGGKGRLTGTAETQSGTVTFDKVELEGSALTVTFPAGEDRGAKEVTVIVTGDTFEGTIEMGSRSAAVRGTRTQGPEGGGR